MNKEDKIHLSELYSESRTLEQKRLAILVKYADPVRAASVYNVVTGIHEHIYELPYSEDSTYKDMIEAYYDGDESSLAFFEDNKHIRFTRSVDVYNTFEDKTIQKRLKREGYLNKRKMKKARTPNQHLETVYEAKRAYDRDLLANETQHRLKLLELRMSQLQADLDLLDRKVCCYQMKQGDPKLTYRDLGEIFDVSDSTIKRWLRDQKGSR